MFWKDKFMSNREYAPQKPSNERDMQTKIGELELRLTGYKDRNKVLTENYDRLLERASELAVKVANYEESMNQDFDSTYPQTTVTKYVFDLKLENIELRTTLEQRDLEITALKHMLDRKDEE